MRCSCRINEPVESTNIYYLHAFLANPVSAVPVEISLFPTRHLAVPPKYLHRLFYRQRALSLTWEATQFTVGRHRTPRILTRFCSFRGRKLLSQSRAKHGGHSGMASIWTMPLPSFMCCKLHSAAWLAWFDTLTFSRSGYSTVGTSVRAHQLRRIAL